MPYLLDLDEAESAAVLGWPRGTVKSRLHRALARLRDVLDSRRGAECKRGRGRTMGEHEYDDLARDLAALGRAVDVPAPGPGLAGAVLERLRRGAAARRAPATGPRRRLDRARGGCGAGACSPCWRPRRCARRSRTGSASAACGWSGATPRHRRPTRRPPRCRRAGPWRRQSAMVSVHRCRLPRRWATPDGVEVSDDRRMVSMSWDHRRGGGAAPRPVRRQARLLGPQDRLATSATPRSTTPTRCGSRSRTRSRCSSPTGPQVTHSARLAGHTLIWHDGRRDAPAGGRRRAQQGRGDRRVGRSPVG